MAGIHVHTHDVTDEGPTEIAKRLQRLDDLEYVFAQVNTIFERNPSPVGTLEHNPVRDVVTGTGTLHADIDPARLSPRLHQVVDRSFRPEADPLDLLRGSRLERSYQIVPWLSILNGRWAGHVAANHVLDFTGEPVQEWLCPNGPDVVEMWAQTIVALTGRYGYRTYLIDRIRYPDWSGPELRPWNIFSCFCMHCIAAMTENGIDVVSLRQALEALRRVLKDGDFDHVPNGLARSRLQQWVTFRQTSVTSMVTRLIKRVHELDPGVELWLDTWPPAYAWLLGQDYAALTSLTSALKHFPYHKLGGGADVQGLIEYFAQSASQREEAFHALRRLCNLDHDQSYADFAEHGFPIQFVADQNALVREQSGSELHLFSGVQMWNISAPEVGEAAHATYRSGADPIYYCYGWAAEDLFGASNGSRATVDGSDSQG